MGLESILNATDPQFRNLYKEKSTKDPSTIEFQDEQYDFVERCQGKQSIALQHHEELQRINVSVQQISEAFHKIIHKSQQISTGLYDRELIDGKFRLTGHKINRSDLCDLCPHEEPYYHEYTLLNEKLQIGIELRELNLHSILVHNSFSQPGKWGGHDIDPISACKVLGIIR
jgi:hypothetical protein